MDEEELIEGILHLLQGTSPTFDGSGYTLLQILEFLELNNVKTSIKELRNLLIEMDENGLIEERNFDEKHHGRVDYSIDQKGIDLIEKRRKGLKARGIRLDNKWKISDLN